MLKAMVFALALTTLAGCNVLGPSCLARQHRGPVTTLSGEVAAGTVVPLQVKYGTDGSQNDLHITWSDQYTAGGPRIRVYATTVDCDQFLPPSNQSDSPASRGNCGNIGGSGGFLSDATGPCATNRTCNAESSNFVQTSLIITHGQGNPEKLGPSAEYKLWIVGDPERKVRYTIEITWFSGPDC